ncbi:MAG: hypothetical protein AB7V16_02085 [Vulcanibacillus sp.]
MIAIKWKKIALILGGIAFILVVLFNLRVNLFLTAVYRGFIAFGIFFLLGVVISILFHLSIDKNTKKGINIDLKTTNENNINYDEIYNLSKDNNFEPLKLNKINSSE